MTNKSLEMFKSNEAAVAVIDDERLPYLKFMNASCSAVKNEVFPHINSYALIKGDNYTNLGKTVDVVVVAVRGTAMDYNDPFMCVHSDTSATIHDADAGFKRIKDLAGIPNSKASWGYEFLLWLPEEKCFAVFFFGSPSARRVAKRLITYLAQTVTLKCQHVTAVKNPYSCTDFAGCDTPLTAESLPSEKEYHSVLEAFKNPTNVAPELASPAASSGRET